MSELIQFKAERTAIRRSVTKYIKKIEAVLATDHVNLIELEECIELLKQKESELRKLNGEIKVLITDPKDLETEIDSVQEYADKIYLWKFKGEKLLKNQNNDLNKSENKSDTTISEQSFDNIRLPKLSLPTFSGNITEWIAFKDLFNACVKSNTSLSNAQKLQYLKVSLKGEAYRIVQSIQISDDNFKIAWDLVNERYSNKREQVFAYIKRFLSLPNVQTESAIAILNLVDNINEIIRSLEVLGQTIDNFGDSLMTYLILQKLDCSTKLWWERQLECKEIPKLKELIEFLKNYARTLQNSKPTFNRVPKPVFQNKSNALVATSSCGYCKEDHNLAKCSKFLNLNVQQRIDFVKVNHYCFNCLSNMHLLKKCRSLNTCNHCSKKHHSILHIVNKSRNNAQLNSNAQEFIPKQDESVNDKNISSAVCASRYELTAKTYQNNHVLLCTALIKVQNSEQQFVKCRCLLDTGSQKSFISRECVSRLGLTVNDSSISVSCLGTFNTVCNGAVDLVFTSHFKSDIRVSTSAFVMEKVTDNIPYVSLPAMICDNFSDLKLADPSFYKSQKIDILLGVNVFLHLVTGEIVKRDPNLPFALNSRLGWIISGTTNLEVLATEPVYVNHVNTDELVNSFWELEKVPNVQPLTAEEKLCEKHFESSHFREKTGRYSVALPFKHDRDILGDSREIARRRFLYLEKRLVSMPDIYNQYIQFMKEYFSLGHMELVPNADHEKHTKHYYIPHHFVLNESSLTTKLRVVFDASAKTTTGISLNDTLMIGPKTQDDLICILMRFRFHNIAITADIRMMYRQVKIHEKDRDFQKILWRENPNRQIQEYRLNTVTYGTAAAPYLATKVLSQLAIDEGHNFPKAKSVVSRDFYVDDVLTGVKNNQEGAVLIEELQQMLKKGGFELHKWSTNEPLLFKNAGLAHSGSDNSHSAVNNKAIKVLGLEWHPENDEFKCNISEIEYQKVPTKRIILSCASKLFDPLGWIAPFVILTKMILQKLWKLQLSWDDPVPEEIDQKWKILCKEVKLLNSIHIPRKVLLPDYLRCTLHGFCDASEKGYAAVIYVKTFNGSNIDVKLLTAKTRVAPLKPITIPRLELCAAVLLAHLMQAVRDALVIKIDSVHAWSDSQIVLSWLKSDPKRWQTFVSNRVSEIQSILPFDNWSHVDGKENPADCASRGLFPAELLSNELWWNGPPWLKCYDVPVSKIIHINEDELPEVRKTVSFVVSEAVKEPDIISKISSFSKLQRIFAWILRFISNSKATCLERNTSFLSSKEIRSAKLCIIRIVQRMSFSKEIQCLEIGKSLPTNSNLISLCPFLDGNNVLRVGGRLKNAQLSENEKHPILLPSRHHLTKIIIRHFHEKYLHASPELLLSLIRQQFWIIAARSVIRKIVRTCVRCCKHRAQPASQIMADLPASRVIQARPFHRVGLDFSGPFMIKYRAGRGQKSFKSYVCIFVCFVVKAVHLEVVEDLSTKAFLSALRRFVARRGKPMEMHSDCGTNFKGAEKEINKWLLQCNQNPELHDYFASEEIKWIFNPPSAPHFGGLWESSVKSMKSHLKKTTSCAVLTYPEFQTVIAQIEACLNSRPLCPMSSDPTDLTALTPGHFLVGTPLTTIPEPDLTHSSVNRLDRWHVRQLIFQQFWKRWSREYLLQLQQRPKWQKGQRNLEVNDLVLIKEDNLPPLNWKLGRIIAVYPGSDNKVRVVTIKTGQGIIKRPVVKLCPLPID